MSAAVTPIRPFLFLNAADLARVRERIQRHAWAQATWTGIGAETRKWLGKDICCPTVGAGSSLDYRCAACRRPLEPDPGQEGVHRCPFCKKEHRGDMYDRGSANYRHHALAQAAQDLALVGVVDREAPCLQQAREILLAYVRAFPSYARSPGAGILSVGRSEATMMYVPLAFAYDLVAGAGALSAAEMREIEAAVLRPAIDDQLQGAGEGGMELSNHAVWAVAGAFILALCVGDDRLTRHVLNSAAGSIAALTRGLRDDSQWWEGSMTYHVHTLIALLWSAEASRHTPFNLYASAHGEALRQMMLAPLRLAGPDDTFPAVNDSPRWQMAGDGALASLYELGLARFGDPEIAGALHRAYAGDVSKRAGAVGGTKWGHPRTAFFPFALLYGLDEIPTGRPVVRESRVMPALGFVRLGGEPGFEKPYLVLTYGEQDAGHKHADRLGFLYEYDGVPLIADSGYGFANWKNSTIAHNTVVVDETSHSPAGGALRAFENLPWVKLVRVTAGQTCLAQGVTLERVQALLPEALIDVFHARGDHTHTFDYLLHSPAVWQTAVTRQAAGGPAFGSAAYQPLESQKTGKVSKPWTATLVSPTQTGEAIFPLAGNSEIVLARTQIDPNVHKAEFSLLAVRKRGRSALFVSVVLPMARSSGPIREVRRLSPARQDDWLAIALIHTNGSQTLFSFDTDPTLPFRRLGDLRVRARIAMFLLAEDRKVRETVLVDGLVATQSEQELPVKLTVPPLRLEPPAAALLPGKTREFILYSYEGALRGTRVSLTGGLRVSPIRWRYSQKTWQGRFTVTAPPTATPTLSMLGIKPAGVPHRIKLEPTPIAVLPPPVKAVVCRQAEAGRRRVGLEADSRWDKAATFYLPIVANQVQRAFTQVKTFRDQAAVYFRLTCGEPLMRKIVTDAAAEHPALLFNDDHVEILLDTDGDPATYFQLGVNAANLGMAHCFGQGEATLTWHHRVRRMKDRWEVTVTIPYGGVVTAPRRGAKWTVNVVRLRRPAGREDSAMVIGAGGYHCPKQFLPMKLS